MKDYKKLIAWQKGFAIAKSVYALTSTFPASQKYRLCDQMERSAVSIFSNLAEGSRRTPLEWKQYVRISLGSASELEAQLLLSRDLRFGSSERIDEILKELDEVSRLLCSYFKF